MERRGDLSRVIQSFSSSILRDEKADAVAPMVKQESEYLKVLDRKFNKEKKLEFPVPKMTGVRLPPNKEIKEDKKSPWNLTEEGRYYDAKKQFYKDFDLSEREESIKIYESECEEEEEKEIVLDVSFARKQDDRDILIASLKERLREKDDEIIELSIELQKQ